MVQKPSSLRRTLKTFHRRSRELKMIVKGLLSTDHPVQAQIIPVRRCNLACAYCNEYDDVSKPVTKEEMFARVDHLGKLGTTIIVISAGEPLLHPDLDEIFARIASQAVVPRTLHTGY